MGLNSEIVWSTPSSGGVISFFVMLGGGCGRVEVGLAMHHAGAVEEREAGVGERYVRHVLHAAEDEAAGGRW